MPVETLRPTSNGTYTAWTPNAGSIWDRLDESSQDGDTTYISNNDTSSPFDKFSVNVADFTPAFSTITKVEYKFVAKKAFGSGTDVYTAIVIADGVESEPASFDLTASYAEYVIDITAAASWTDAILDGLQIGGRKNVASSNTLRVTQAWVEVTYTVSGTVQTGSFGSYAKAHLTDSGSFGSYASGREPVTDSFGAYAQAIVGSVGSFGAFSRAKLPDSGSFGAYATGPSVNVVEASKAAYAAGRESQTGSFGSFARGKITDSGSFGAYANGFLASTGSFGAYAKAVSADSGSFGAFAQGPTTGNGSLGAYARGVGPSRAMYRKYSETW
jgi:hypothetical protein